MRTPSVEDLSPRHLRAARAIAGRLAEAGFPAWIVGGAARDLARGVTPEDLDMVSPATPDRVEALFERTIGVGKAFGILVVVCEGAEVELATLRTERGHSDARRPDEVLFGTSVEEDAARRDFTCNALYLDPCRDEWLDPVGGLEDLRAGLLRAVGDPARRFAEDGLRLLRMARFQAGLGLELAPGLLEAAAAGAESLRGVSPERVRGELARIFAGPAWGTALETLARSALLERALPAWAASGPLPVAARRAALEALPDPPGEVLGWAWLLEPDPLAPEQDLERDLGLLDALRPSRSLRRAVERAWSLRRVLPTLAEDDPAARARALREPGWEAGCDLALAWAGAAERAPLRALRAWREVCEERDLFPPALLGAADLAAAGVPRGPAWGQLLSAAEDEQLAGRLPDRAAALAWLAGRKDPA